MSDIQENVEFDGNAISGTLKYLSEGQIVSDWGAGNFLVLKFDWTGDVDKVMVGLNPSQGSGLVDITDDPDKNGVFKITDPNNQAFKVQLIKGENISEYTFTLSGLTMTPAPNTGVG